MSESSLQILNFYHACVSDHADHADQATGVITKNHPL